MRKKTNLLTTASFLVLLLIILHTPIGSQFNLQIVKPVKASPATIIVPTNFTKIQDAINNASDGDIILVEAGTYPEHVVVNKTVSLIGENPANTIIDGNGTGTVVRVTSPNVSIINFTIRNGGGLFNDFGVWVLGADNTTIRNSIIRDNPSGGIQLRLSNNNNIIGDTMINNWAGVIFKYSNGSNVIGNTLTNSTYGAYIEYSSSNTFYRNNFINNTERPQVWIVDAPNNWDNGAEGNYWSDYTSKDLDGDGIGDEPYPEPIFPIDSYPLIEPWSLIRVLDVYQSGEHHYVTIYCNSTVGHQKGDVSFLFSQPGMQIRFNVTGPSGTLGFCNVTIPKTLLNATMGNWTVRFDGTNITDTVDMTENATHTFFNFNYTHSRHRVRIIGTWAIPNEPPIANFTYSPLNPTILDLVTFTDTSNDSDGEIVRWFWEFGDGSNSTVQFPTHKYANKGSYNVTLTVTDNVQASNTTTQTITVIIVAPTANFTYSPTAPRVNQEVNFTDTSLDPEESIVERLWDFGDGNVTTVTTQFITHIYTAGGTYNVTLTVKDDENATDTIWKTITVRKLGTNLTIDAPPTATSGRSVTITANLEDENGAPIWNATIKFYLFENGTWKNIGSSLTDSDGVAVFEYTPHDAGTLYIRAEFPGTQVHGKTTSDEIELNVARARFDYTPYILVAVAAIAAVALIAFAIWRKRRKPSKI